jgi:hypothetical protein
LFTDDFTYFELDTANSATGYEKNGYKFNFCNYLSSGNYFAEYNGQGLTSDEYLPSKTGLKKDENDNIVGVSVTRESENLCKTADDGTEIDYQFTMVVMCDAGVTGAGAAKIDSLDSSDSCHPVVTVSHADGCYEYTASPLIRWLSDNPYVLGIVFLVLGPIIAMCGKRWFPYIAATMGGMFVGGFFMLVAGALGWLNSTVWMIVCFIIAAALGVGFGMLLKKVIWLAVGLVGIVGGFYLGSFLYTLILHASGWESYWGYWGIALSFAILGGVLSCKFGKNIVLLGTSFFGSYIFVSGLNYVLGGSPGLAEICGKLADGQHVVFTSATYVYLAVLICMFAFTAVW